MALYPFRSSIAYESPQRDGKAFLGEVQEGSMSFDFTMSVLTVTCFRLRHESAYAEVCWQSRAATANPGFASTPALRRSERHARREHSLMSNESEVCQGDVFWISAESLRPSVQGVPHPHVVIQADVLNKSRIPTTVVCGLSSNLRRANEAGNVLLEVGESNLPHRSVAIVSQISTVEKSVLLHRIGTLSQQRVEQIFAGLSFLQKTYFERGDR
jgi:mRNA interferase MazF